MSSDNRDLMVSVRGLSKMYTISHVPQRGTTLGEAMMRRLRAPLARNQTEAFWALRDVSFDVHRGDVVGIIGRNGAGKSTLLKVLSRITEPTTGAIDLYGRIGSLLEVGTGFHPELTGRENVYLNGAILGMSKTEVRRQFDAIVAFADVEKFLDTPVKRYSSGMYVRLAFAVAAHLNPEILIVDEVLAVGDAAFQQKCLGKMKDVAGSGRTVLFVSHNMGAIRTLCSSGLLMSRGQLTGPMPTQEAIRQYSASGSAESAQWTNDSQTLADQRCVQRIAVKQEGQITEQISIAAPFEIEIELAPRAAGEKSLLAIHICDGEGNIIYHSMDIFPADAADDDALHAGNRVMTIPAFGLAAGDYKLSYWLGHPGEGIWDQRADVLTWRVVSDSPAMARYPHTSWKGFVGPGLATWKYV